MEQLNVFEGREQDQERKTIGRRLNTTYRGIDDRVGRYKTVLIGIRKESNPNLQINKSDQELKLKSAVQVVGTPPGYRSSLPIFSSLKPTNFRMGHTDRANWQPSPTSTFTHIFIPLLLVSFYLLY